MDDIKFRAGEKLGALHNAAKSVAVSGKTKTQDVMQQTLETVNKIREIFSGIWNNELIAESRERVAEWSRDAVQRIKQGAPPLSPLPLYDELVTLFRDRLWRHSMIIFMCGCLVGGGAGLACGLRMSARPPTGPHARALYTQPDQSVMLVDDATTPAAGSGEVLVRVQAFSVCTIDRCVLRRHSATLRSLVARNSHCTVGRGFAGVILDVGVGVTDLELGDEVWGCVSEWNGGAASELLTIRSTRVSKRPRGMAADAAASVPWGGALALAATERLKLGPDTCKGRRVAVVGAGSGEGCALVQLLAAWGARVAVLAPRHASLALQDLGADELIESESPNSLTVPTTWATLERHAVLSGPWDCLLLCGGAGTPSGSVKSALPLLKATASRNAILDLRPTSFLSDRLPTPITFLYGASFYSFRMLRWLLGLGTNTDWLEDKYRLTGGLAQLAELVDSHKLAPVLDKVYLPQDFETALAHACSDEAIGTTVIRFP